MTMSHRHHGSHATSTMGTWALQAQGGSSAVAVRSQQQHHRHGSSSSAGGGGGGIVATHAGVDESLYGDEHAWHDGDGGSSGGGGSGHGAAWGGPVGLPRPQRPRLDSKKVS